MISFDAAKFVRALNDLLQLERDVGSIDKEKTANKPLQEQDATRARIIIADFLGECERAGLTRPLERGDRLKLFGELRLDHYPLEKVCSELSELRQAAYADLSNRRFSYLEETAERHYEKPDLFGPAVADRFPAAAYDISEAGSCHATGRYTACVFHSMRVLEYGLRDLAKRVTVPFPKAFDLKTWDGLIREIENEVQKIIKQPNTQKRVKDLQFYNGAAAQFRYFKDGWRNHVMHTRTSYDEHQAMSVLVHVREFMQHLATGR